MCIFQENHVDMVKLLLVFGANPLKKNNDGCTAVDVAATDISMKAWLNVPSVSRREGAPPKIKKGERMLFLDGGGMRGLLEIEVLLEIERRTGRQIVELFDWIVGTSIGGVIALALVYGKCVPHTTYTNTAFYIASCIQLKPAWFTI